MQKIRKKQSGSDPWVIILLCVLAAGVGLWYFWPHVTGRLLDPGKRAPSGTPAPAQPEPGATDYISRKPGALQNPLAEEARTPAPVIPYKADDPDFQELMERRKAAYGLDRSVDLIVRPDETLQMGEHSVPMAEVLEKIRIYKGDIAVQDLEASDAGAAREKQTETVMQRMEAAARRQESLALSIAEGEATDPAVLQDQVATYAELKRSVAPYRAWAETGTRMEEYEALERADDPRRLLSAKIEQLTRRRGELLETLQELMGDRLDPSRTPMGQEEMLRELAAVAERFNAIERQMEQPEAFESVDAMRRLILEWAALREIVGYFREYRKTVRDLAQTRSLMALSDAELTAHIDNHLAFLQVNREDLRHSLMAQIFPDEAVEVYGVYVVRPGDNIWDIHFAFLKDYFGNKGVTVGSDEDEPDRKGRSSGVGKILKFSEGMVYIYNLKEQKIAENLNLIHPLSKIVVFNMGEALDLLEQIDYDRIRYVRFDGETLWIPSR